MASPEPADKQEYAFWQREKAAADTEHTPARKLSKKLNMTAEQTHDYLAMLAAH